MKELHAIWTLQKMVVSETKDFVLISNMFLAFKNVLIPLKTTVN